MGPGLLTYRNWHIDYAIGHDVQIAILARDIPRLLSVIRRRIGPVHLEAKLSLHYCLLQEISVFVKGERRLGHSIHRLARVINNREFFGDRLASRIQGRFEELTIYLAPASVCQLTIHQLLHRIDCYSSQIKFMNFYNLFTIKMVQPDY